MIVVNVRDIKPDWREDSRYVDIRRGSPWGNRWLIGVLTRLEAIDRYREDVASGKIRDIEKLRGKEFLVCSCAPLPCHGEVLIEWLKER